MPMHEDELQVTVDQVRELVYGQFPEWAQLPITPADSAGTSNAIFRIGGELAARLPLRPGAVAETRRALRSEAEAAIELAEHTSFAVPSPVALGQPGEGYPLPWSVETWIPGKTASEDDTASSTDFAHDVARFVREVRTIDVAGRRFTGDGRGGDLRSHDKWMEVCFEHSDHLFDITHLREIWARMRELPRRSPDLMTHGDLVPGNVLVANGRLTGILDVGGLGPTDLALDLVGAWHLLDRGPRQVFREDLGCDDLEWERGKAWAFQQALGAAWYYEGTNTAMHKMGLITLERILADDLKLPGTRDGGSDG